VLRRPSRAGQTSSCAHPAAIDQVGGRVRVADSVAADDFGADLAERRGCINRAMPAEEFDDFVWTLAHRSAAFPAAGRVAVKKR